MPTYHFEDFVPDSVAEFGPRLVTREEIIDFAAQFDPQPMHLDEDAGRASMLGGLAASGEHGRHTVGGRDRMRPITRCGNHRRL